MKVQQYAWECLEIDFYAFLVHTIYKYVYVCTCIRSLYKGLFSKCDVNKLRSSTIYTHAR